MKTISTLFLAMSITFGFAQNPINPIDFEAGGHGASWGWTCFEDGSVAPALEIVSNPNPSGINTSATVAKFTAVVAGAAYAGCQSAHGSDIGTFSLTSSTSTVKMMVYKSVISPVGIKFDDPAGAAFPEVKVSNTKINEWEELTFDVSSSIGVSRDRIIVFMDYLLPRAQDNICYFDNIIFTSGTVVVPGGSTLPLNCETPVTFADFDGGVATQIANPHVGGINTSATVGQIVRNGGQIWAGSKTVLGSNLDFTTKKFITMKVFTTAPIGTDVKFKLEGGTPTVEKDVVTTVTGAWETLKWDFTNTASNLNTLVLMFDYGKLGDGTATSTFLFDDIQQSSGLDNGINNIESSQAKMYPNPAKNDLTVILGNSSSVSNIEILNSIGQTIYSSIIPKGQDRLNVDLTGYLTGTYFVKIQNVETVVVKKFVKE